MRVPMLVVIVVVALVAGATGALLATVGGSATAQNSSITYYACLTTTKTLSKVGTVSPNCKNGSQLISWNSEGLQGPPGASTAVTGYSVVQNTERDNISTSGAWTSLPEATVTIPPQSNLGIITVRFWASSSCFGTGNKYAQTVWNGTPGPAVVPLAAYPAVGGSQAEIGSTLEDNFPTSASEPVTVSINVETDAGSNCVINPGEWQMTVETVNS